jgi:sialic acid synthase SpsE/sugar phosphate isomerase/epimerase
MLIERDVTHYTVLTDDSIEHALRQITHNGRRTVFCIEQNGVLAGVITDGDFRRWLLANPGESLSSCAIDVANRTFVSAPFGTSIQEIELLFNSGVQLVPLLDELGRLVAVARPRTHEMWIEHRRVDSSSPAFLVAEIGINHNGSLDTTKRLIEVAARAGADCAKFQMRDMDSLYRNAGATGDHREDLGPQYTLDLLDRFSLTVEEMFEAFDECRRSGLIPLCTPWDLASARLLEEYGIGAFKVASADLTNHELLSYLAQTGRPIIVSTGMSSESEIAESVQLLRSSGAPFALLHCNSTYPAPFRDINLRYMDRLAEIGDCLVGYSGHERGHHVAVAAVARGAAIIEKHITLDRRLEGNDHKVSLQPDELIDMVREIRNIEEALGTDAARTISQGEMMNRVNLAKSLVARVPLTAGDQITEEHIEVRSPGRGLQPNRRHDLVGRISTRDMTPGDFFFESDLRDALPAARNYTFRRRWGLPVRYHDCSKLASLSNPDFLEFHMSYRDLEVDVAEMVPAHLPLGLVVHSPDLFPGDHILNLASEDESYRDRSIQELQRVITVTRELGSHFETDGPILLVASLGGFSSEGPLPASELPLLYERVAASLDQLDEEGVEVIPQTLPPFPWYLGGQLFCNLFVDPEDTFNFSQKYGRRLCLDIAHTKLACNHLHTSFFDAVETLAPVSAHLHVVDAAGIDGEGFQIDEGEVDFRVLAEQVDRLAPDATFIPEIWQGHQNLGEGFWVALDRLEKYL